MVSILNLIKCIIIMTIFFCCQYQARIISDDNNEVSDFIFGDDLREQVPNQQDQFYHQLVQRASLRYHPHVLYKKASLKPIIGQHGTLTFNKRDDE
ncbi:unnamed protein product [Rotaria sp. Silwood2]|nr:unnamed protein product [Rotaria sp. Silwood2]CAF2795276.1 unnamed protein product [Rotaria sp. Silwood2]CAF2924268.1 unnamed protein product [Rotaria sp. Silwood2]CAF3974166.1 unnamed protein product [Rotaria sp. Silwood2]CAF4074722.1 unnamed protein product [Rotaria sp. Silwood2]